MGANTGGERDQALTYIADGVDAVNVIESQRQGQECGLGGGRAAEGHGADGTRVPHGEPDPSKGGPHGLDLGDLSHARGRWCGGGRRGRVQGRGGDREEEDRGPGDAARSDVSPFRSKGHRAEGEAVAWRGCGVAVSSRWRGGQVQGSDRLQSLGREVVGAEGAVGCQEEEVAPSARVDGEALDGMRGIGR